MDFCSEISYHKIAGVAEILVGFGQEDKHKSTQLADSDGHEAGDNEDPVPVACLKNLRLYP